MEVLLAALATLGATLLLMFGGIVLVGGVVWLCSWWLTREEVARQGAGLWRRVPEKGRSRADPAPRGLGPVTQFRRGRRPPSREGHSRFGGVPSCLPGGGYECPPHIWLEFFRRRNIRGTQRALSSRTRPVLLRAAARQPAGGRALALPDVQEHDLGRGRPPSGQAARCGVAVATDAVLRPGSVRTR